MASCSWAPTQVLLISDGESHVPLRTSVFDKFRKLHIPIFTLKTGTVEGSPIPVQTRRRYRSVLKDSSGKIVKTSLDPEKLENISKLTAAESFDPNLDEIDRLAGFINQSFQSANFTTTFQVAREFYPWLFLFAFLFFLLNFSMDRWEYTIRSLLIVLAFSASTALLGEQKNVNPEEQLRAQIEKEKDANTKSILTYNLATHYSKNKQLKQAAEFFQESVYLTQDEQVKKKALFNLANTQLQSGDPKAALESYQEAYSTQSPDDEFNNEANKNISENMVLATKVMKMMQQQQKKEGKDGEGGEPKDPKGPKKDYQARYFTEERKRRIFDLISAQEQEAMQAIQRKRSQKQQPRSRSTKPW